jgi:hypothetical protein
MGVITTASPDSLPPTRLQKVETDEKRLPAALPMLPA